MIQLVKSVKKHSQLLKLLASLNLKDSLARTRLGGIWLLVDPLFLMGIYYFMVAVVFKRGGPDYHLFALIGILSWQFFSRSLKMVSVSIYANRQLLKQVPISLETLGLPGVCNQFLITTIGYMLVICFNWSNLSSSILQVIPLSCLIGVFSIAFGIALSPFMVLLPDLSKIIDYILRAGFFVTPILYPASRILDSTSIPVVIKELYSWNPMGWAISSLRTVLLYGESVPLMELIVWSIIAFVLLQISLVMNRHFSRDILKRL